MAAILSIHQSSYSKFLDTLILLHAGGAYFKANGIHREFFKYFCFQIIFQFHQLLPEFTAIENVCIPAMIKGTPSSEAQAKATELLTFLGLSDRS